MDEQEPTPQVEIRTREEAPDGVLEFWRTLATLTPRVWVTPLLVGANVAVYALMVATGVHWTSPTIASLIEWGANSGPLTAGGQWWRLMSCVFVHIGLVHIALNMLVLWDVGHVVERLVGNLGFLISYLVSGLLASLVSIWWNPWVVSAGASGAVFGAFGALLGFVAFRHDAVPLAVRQRVLKSGASFLVYNVIFGLMIKNIDLAAHLGGLAAGFVCGLLQSQRLSPEAASGRVLRNLLVLVVGGMLTVSGAYGFLLVRGQPVDVAGKWERLGKVEEQVLARFNATVNDVNQGRITEAQMADVLEAEILPPWREAKAGMEEVRKTQQVRRANLESILRYMQVRQEAWELMVKALRSGDRELASQAAEKQAAADKLASELSAGD